VSLAGGIAKLVHPSRPSRCLAWALCLSLVGILFAVVPLSAAFGLKPLSQLPLWKAVPNKAYISLGGESGGGARWEAFAFAQKLGARKKLCLQIVEARRVPGGIGISSGHPECGLVGPGIAEPVAAASAYAGHKSVVVVATGTSASKMEMTLTPSQEVTAPARVLNAAQARKLKFHSFVYAILEAAGETCINQIEGFASDGNVAFEQPRHACSVGP
jgi:hypothetical protein